MNSALHTSIDPSTWNDFVSRSPQGSVFSRTEFVEALGVDYELVMLVENRQPVLGAIVLLCEGQVVRAPFPLTMYHGVLCNGAFQTMPNHKRSKWLMDKITTLLSELEKRYARVSFCLHHQFEDVRPFQWFHYHEQHLGRFSIDVRYTGIIDLEKIADFEEFLAQVRTVRRQEYRKAVADGFVVEESDDIDLLDRLHRMTFERQGLVRDSGEEQLVRNISHAALDNGFGNLLVCCDKHGRPMVYTCESKY